jgi:hypothetical protein
MRADLQLFLLFVSNFKCLMVELCAKISQDYHSPGGEHEDLKIASDSKGWFASHCRTNVLAGSSRQLEGVVVDAVPRLMRLPQHSILPVLPIDIPPINPTRNPRGPCLSTTITQITVSSSEILRQTPRFYSFIGKINLSATLVWGWWVGRIADGIRELVLG